MPGSKNSKLVVSAIEQWFVRVSYTRMCYKMKPTYYFFCACLGCTSIFLPEYVLGVRMCCIEKKAL